MYFMVTLTTFSFSPFNHFGQYIFNSVFGGKQLSFPRRSSNLLLKDLTPSSASGDADLRITTYFVQQWMAIRYDLTMHLILILKSTFPQELLWHWISYTGRNCDLSNDFLPFTSQDCLEYFGIIYNESVSDLLSYHHGDRRSYHREVDSNSDPVNYFASPSYFVIQQENISDYPVGIACSNSSTQSSSESSRDSETTPPSTEPSASATPGDVEQGQVEVQPGGRNHSHRENAFTCPQCHKVFSKNSVLR